ncbi:MAG: ester cyclase [Saprospiraceae bacterium]|nr:ester cyclase [Saprospiraceae bacterium]
MKTKNVFLILLNLFVIHSISFTQEKKAGKIITDYFTWVDAGKIEEVGTLLTEDFIATAPFSPNSMDKMAWKGIGQGFKTAFPDMKHEIIDWFADENKVAVKGIFKGTNLGSMMGNPPTGGKVAVAFNSYFELNGNGKIKMINIQFNMKEFEMQLLANVPDLKIINEKTVRDLFQVMDGGQTNLFSNYCSLDFKISNPFLPAPSPIQAFQSIIQAQKAGFPDMKHEILKIISDTYHVTTFGNFIGTNTGSMMGNQATGNKVKVAFLVLDEMDGHGKIKNRNVQFDSKAFEAQLMAGINPNAQIEKSFLQMFEAADRADTASFISYWSMKAKNYFAGIENSNEDFKNRLLSFKKGFPDVKRTIDEIQINNNKISVRGWLSGTNKGSFMGRPATNNKIKVSWLGLYHLNSNGKIESGWVEFDTATLEKQLMQKTKNN